MKLYLIPLLVLLSSCAFWGSNEEERIPYEPTLAELAPAVLPEQRLDFPRVSLEELSATYREVLESNSDPQIKLQVRDR